MSFKTIKEFLIILLATCFAIVALPNTVFAKGEYRTILSQNECGLVVEVDEKLVDLGNLNPGDSKQSTIKLSNQGSNDITLYIKTNILNEVTKNGGYLAEIMNLTMKDGKNVISNDSFRNISDSGNVYIGILRPGKTKILDLSTYLSGDEAGNDYQGAYMKVSWVFTSQCSSSDQKDKENKDKSNGKKNQTGKKNQEDPVVEDEEPIKVEEISVDDELIPGGTNEPAVDQPENPTGIPYGYPKIPQTGQLSSMYFYGIGALLVMAGNYLKKK